VFLGSWAFWVRTDCCPLLPSVDGITVERWVSQQLSLGLSVATPEGTVVINARCSLRMEGGYCVVFVAGLAVHHWSTTRKPSGNCSGSIALQEQAYVEVRFLRRLSSHTSAHADAAGVGPLARPPNGVCRDQRTALSTCSGQFS